jgi:hypothetical protein
MQLSNVRTTMPYNISSLSHCPHSGVQKECQRVTHFIAHNEVFQMPYLNDEQKKGKLFVLVLGDELVRIPISCRLIRYSLAANSNLHKFLNGKW